MTSLGSSSSLKSHLALPMAEEAPTDTVHIPSNAKNKKDAKRFLIFMARADVQD